MAAPQFVCVYNLIVRREHVVEIRKNTALHSITLILERPNYIREFEQEILVRVEDQPRFDSIWDSLQAQLCGTGEAADK